MSCKLLTYTLGFGGELRFGDGYRVRSGGIYELVFYQKCSHLVTGPQMLIRINFKFGNSRESHRMDQRKINMDKEGGKWEWECVQNKSEFMIVSPPFHSSVNCGCGSLLFVACNGC